MGACKHDGDKKVTSVADLPDPIIQCAICGARLESTRPETDDEGLVAVVEAEVRVVDGETVLLVPLDRIAQLVVGEQG